MARAPSRARCVREPPGVRHHEGGSFSFPSWPQAHYLSRIAADLPVEVATTIESVPIVDNESVHLVFLEAGARMPPEEAARVARHEAPWLAARERWIGGVLPRAVEGLALRLLDGGQVDAALVLVRAALSLSPPDNEHLWRGPVARIESWSYGELAGKVIPALAAKSTTIATELLIELIAVGGVDGAWGSRRRMDAGAHPGIDEPTDILFALVRDLYLARAAIGESDLRQAVGELEAKGARIYQRLALHLLRVHGKAAPDMIVERATDQSRLGAGDEDDEITLMIRDRFRDLGADDQTRVLAALRENASVDAMRQEFDGRLDEPQLAKFSKHRLVKWLHALGDARPASVNDEYDALVAEVGAPEPFFRGPLFGPNPPRRAAELLDLSDAELLLYLRDWVPTSTDPFEPSREGLGREIQKCATEHVERFTRIARDFRGLAPAYVANLLWGIHEVTKLRTEDPEKPVVLPPIDWESVLELLEWVVQQPVTSDAEGAPGNWTWARQMAVGVADDVVDAMVTTDHARTTRAWSVVGALMLDTDPTPERDAEHSHDAATFALNTVRGQALRAAIKIALTLREKTDGAPSGLLPSVVGEIGSRANPAIEPSAVLRSTLAIEFNSLYRIDAALASALASTLFPTLAESSDERVAAWAEYLQWNPAHQATYAILGEPYARAIAAVGNAEPETAAKLGKHLVWLYVRKAIDLEDTSPLRRFIEGASTAARHAALDDLGRSVYRTEEAVEDEALAPLRMLWDWWSGLAIGRDDAGELTAFGWWFASKHFDAVWSLPALERVLAATSGKIDWDHEVLEKLASLAATAPASVTACLVRIVDSPDEWQVIRNQKAIRALLTELLTTPSAPEARTIASRLVARGWPDFRDLA